MMNTLKILGCSGSIGGSAATTCLQFNEDILIDAGSGLLNQPLTTLEKIDHILLTHSHLDHILGIPLLADAVGFKRKDPINVLGCSETISVIKQHIFNGLVWPDFSILPTKVNPFIKLNEIFSNSSTKLSELTFTPFYVNHTVRCIGYKISSPKSSIIFSGDTGPSDNLIEMINRTEKIKAVIIDVSFSNKKIDIAKKSKHFNPSMLIKELKKIKNKQTIYITHFKPGCEDEIIGELESANIVHTVKALKINQTITF